MANPNWKKGVSGNPAGRPPKNRALTEILSRAGAKKSPDVDGVERSGKQIVARAVWEMLRTGQATLRIDAERVCTLTADTSEWFDFVKWVYSQIDGPPPKPVEVSGKDGGPIIVLSWNDTDGN